MNSINRRYDVIVIGSGPAGSAAVAELTERGLEVLLLDAGREVQAQDFVLPKQRRPSPIGLDLWPRALAMMRGQFRQACRPFYSESTSSFLVNDLQDPYATPVGRPSGPWPKSWLVVLVGGLVRCGGGRSVELVSDLRGGLEMFWL